MSDNIIIIIIIIIIINNTLYIFTIQNNKEIQTQPGFD
jgi:hypothetical protein